MGLFLLFEPLDGTKEYIKRNGEFTVNIALIEKGSPVMGIVYAPVLEKLYFGYNDSAFMCENIDLSMPAEQILAHIQEKSISLPLQIEKNKFVVFVITSYSIHYTKLYELKKHADWRRRRFL